MESIPWHSLYWNCLLTKISNKLPLSCPSVLSFASYNLYSLQTLKVIIDRKIAEERGRGRRRRDVVTRADGEAKRRSRGEEACVQLRLVFRQFHNLWLRSWWWLAKKLSHSSPSSALLSLHFFFYYCFLLLFVFHEIVSRYVAYPISFPSSYWLQYG